MKVRYLGEKPNRVVKLPVPFVSLSEARGQVTFTEKGAVQDMRDDDGKALVEIAPETFETATESKAGKNKDSVN